MLLSLSRSASYKLACVALAGLVLTSCSKRAGETSATGSPKQNSNDVANTVCTPAIIRLNIAAKVHRLNEWATGNIFVVGCREGLRDVTELQWDAIRSYHKGLAETPSSSMRVCGRAEPLDKPDEAVIAHMGKLIGRRVVADWCIDLATEI